MSLQASELLIDLIVIGIVLFFYVPCHNPLVCSFCQQYQNLLQTSSSS